MKQPERLLSRKFCNENPDVWKNEVIPMLRSWKLEETYPTPLHKMLGWLYKKGWLLRIYTQNIDGLEFHEDVIAESGDIVGYKNCVVQSHGSMRDGSVVLYGDSIPKKFYETLQLDFNDKSNVDLLLVIGTSLQVSPFCAIPNLAPSIATRVLVDPNPERVITSNPWTTAKIDLAGKKVELGSLWKKKESCWENEILIESTSDNFVENFFKCSTSIKKGFSLLPLRTVEVISKGKWHLCEIMKTNKDMIKVRRCQDSKIVDVSIKKTKVYRKLSEVLQNHAPPQ